MAKLSIVTYPQKILRARADRAVLNSETQKLIPQMIETMYRCDGIGLAAPQIGVSQQIFIVETSANPRGRNEDREIGIPGEPVAFLNPTIETKSKETEIQEEGCLSLPGIFVPVKRAESIVVLCQTSDATEVTIEATGLIARIFQHEIDHLNGILIIDHISAIKRLKLRKQLKEIPKKHT